METLGSLRDAFLEFANYVIKRTLLFLLDCVWYFVKFIEYAVWCVKEIHRLSSLQSLTIDGPKTRTITETTISNSPSESQGPLFLTDQYPITNANLKSINITTVTEELPNSISIGPLCLTGSIISLSDDGSNHTIFESFCHIVSSQQKESYDAAPVSVITNDRIRDIKIPPYTVSNARINRDDPAWIAAVLSFIDPMISIGNWFDEFWKEWYPITMLNLRSRYPCSSDNRVCYLFSIDTTDKPISTVSYIQNAYISPYSIHDILDCIHTFSILR